jgi:hypothetical protein
MDELAARGLTINEINEKKIREKLREKHGSGRVRDPESA